LPLRSALKRPRSIGVRVIDGGMKGLAGLRRRVAEPPGPEPPVPAPSSVVETARPGPGAPEYGGLWSPKDESDARQLILNDADAEAFERSGRVDAERLAPLIRPKNVVLDLGCGIGRVARYVSPLCTTLWAVDASESMLGFARERLADLPNVRFGRCAGTRIPDLAADSVDVAYSLITLQHLEREDAFALLRDVRRVLRTGGSAYLTFPNLLSDPYLAAFLAYVDGGEVANRARARFYTPEEVRRLLPAAGFAVDKLEQGTEIVVVCS
jgi:ubiquinone/menaquinone biosynthesis C-methylase UbiE